MKMPMILAALLATGAAQPAFTAAAPAAKPQASAPAAPHKIPGVSEDGNAIIAKAQAAPDPELQTLAHQARVAHDQLMSAVMAPVIDVDKVAAAMKAENDVQDQVRGHATDRLVAVLNQLSADDRGTFLRALVLARQQRHAQATPPASNP
jgi:uncharacterized membrane protein